MTVDRFTRTDSLLALRWQLLWGKTRYLVVLTLVTGTAFAQAVSVATLNAAPRNSDSGNPDSATSAPALPAATDAQPASPNAMVVSTAVSNPPEAPDHPKFWDNENRALFTTVALLSAADFAITRSILQNGGKELNPVTRLFSGSTAGLAVNFAGETAGVIGVSYFFHKTGHHRLERITPMLDIGSSSFAILYDLNHR